MADSNIDRTVLAVTGADRAHFLQGLVSNNVPSPGDGLVYAALLTPQGKYLFDFFMLALSDRILIDVCAAMAEGLQARLNMYRLRADVAIDVSDIRVNRGLRGAPTDALPDPRHSAMGWRRYSTDAVAPGQTDWDAIRVAHCIPESGIELLPDDTYILEAGFERLQGVDFKKGCYVGQEVTARMKHKTELKKGYATVRVEGAAPIGTEILNNGKPAGILYTQSGGYGIAYLRFARAIGPMLAGDVTVHYENGP